MYQKATRIINNNSVQQNVVTRVYPSICFSSVSTHPHNKDPNLVDDIREPVSGLESSTSVEDHVNVVKSSSTSSYDTSHKRDHGGYIGSFAGSFAADTAKQGVVKALETGLEIGEMAKKTLDIMWDATKDTTHKLKEVVAGDGDEKEKTDVPRSERSVNGSVKRSGYDLSDLSDLSKKYGEGN